MYFHPAFPKTCGFQCKGTRRNPLYYFCSKIQEHKGYKVYVCTKANTLSSCFWQFRLFKLLHPLPYGTKFPFAFCNADLAGNSNRLKSPGCTHNTQERRVAFPSGCWTSERVGNWPPATGMAMLGPGMVEEPVSALLRGDQTAGFPSPPGSSRERLDPVSCGWILARLWGMWV